MNYFFVLRLFESSQRGTVWEIVGGTNIIKIEVIHICLRFIYMIKKRINIFYLTKIVKFVSETQEWVWTAGNDQREEHQPVPGQLPAGGEGGQSGGRHHRPLPPGYTPGQGVNQRFGSVIFLTDPDPEGRGKRWIYWVFHVSDDSKER